MNGWEKMSQPTDIVSSIQGGSILATKYQTRVRVAHSGKLTTPLWKEWVFAYRAYVHKAKYQEPQFMCRHKLLMLNLFLRQNLYESMNLLLGCVMKGSMIFCQKILEHSLGFFWEDEFAIKRDAN